MKDKQSLLFSAITNVAVQAAKQAGEMIKSMHGKRNEPQFKGTPKDLVTETDRNAEAMILSYIRRYFPNHLIMGEEEFSSHSIESPQAWLERHAFDTIWIIDPLDGTTNFVHGLPYYCISIGVVSHGLLLTGVIYDPSTNELYVAEHLKGAYLNGERIRVSSENMLSHSLIALGLRPSDPKFAFPANMAALQAIAPNVRNLRIVGSAALQLAHVAAGRLSGFLEVGLQAWDICAGALLVAEAGGQVTEMGSGLFTLRSNSIVATNGAIHHSLLSEIKAEGVSNKAIKRKDEAGCSTFPGMSLAL
jgi:myo-inositol-1(or 4)-monophosphatase